MSKLNDAEKMIGAAGIGASGAGIAALLNSVNSILTFIVLLCSAIVGVYGVVKLFRDRQSRARCADRPDKAK